MRWAIALLGFALGCNAAGTPLASQTTDAPLVVTRGALVETVLLGGDLAAVASDSVSAPSGDVDRMSIQWMIADGTAVKKGDKLVEFDNSQFASNLENNKLQVLQAELTFSSAQATRALAIRDKQHALAKAELNLEKARLVAAIDKTLVSERTWQERQLALARAEATVATAKADLAAQKRSAGLDRKVGTIDLDKARRAVTDALEGIDSMVLTAPRDGVAMVANHPWMGKKFKSGDTIRRGWTIVELPDMSAFEIRTELSDVDDGRIALGDHATVTFDARPDQTAVAVVKEISPVARGVGRGGLRRAFDVRLSLEADDISWMRPRMSALAVIAKPALPESALIPRAAIQFGDSDTITTAAGDTTTITIKACDALQCAVAEDIATGTELRRTR